MTEPMTPDRLVEARSLALKRLLDEKSSLAYAERLDYSDGKIAEIRHRVEIAEAEWWPWAEVDRLRAQRRAAWAAPGRTYTADERAAPASGDES